MFRCNIDRPYDLYSLPDLETRMPLSHLDVDEDPGDLPISGQFEGRWVLLPCCAVRLIPQSYISFNANPPPTSSVSRFSKIPLKSAASPAILGAFPLFGALGLASLLLFSWPAFEGNVGNIAVLLGFGSSLK